MYVKAFIVNVNKRLEQYINIVNRVTLQSFWFIFMFVLNVSNKHIQANIFTEGRFGLLK